MATMVEMTCEVWEVGELRAAVAQRFRGEGRGLSEEDMGPPVQEGAGAVWTDEWDQSPGGGHLFPGLRLRPLASGGLLASPVEAGTDEDREVWLPTLAAVLEWYDAHWA